MTITSCQKKKPWPAGRGRITQLVNDCTKGIAEIRMVTDETCYSLAGS